MKTPVFFAALLIGAFGVVSTASARVPSRLQRYQHVARPSQSQTRMQRFHMPVRHFDRATTTTHVRAVRPPARIQRYLVRARTWDGARQYRHTVKTRSQTASTRNGKRDPKVEALLSRRMKQRARCGPDGCATRSRHLVKRADHSRSSYKWTHAVRRSAASKTKGHKREVDPRTKARMRKLRRMFRPTEESCRDAADCAF